MKLTITQKQKQKRIRELENSLIYTPRTQAQRDAVVEALEYARSVNDTLGITLGLAQISQGNEYARLTKQ